MIRLLLAVSLAGVLAACGGGSSPAATAPATSASDPVTKTVTLTGDQEVPAVTTAATGSGSLTLDRATGALSGSITLNGMTATAAHIHSGAAGSNGSVQVNLSETAPGTWSVPANTVLNAAQIAGFNAGTLYVNAHSSAYPSGEIRGQVGMEVYTAALSGKQEVPATSSTATGSGMLVLDPATKTLTGSVTLTGMTATLAHIHAGAVGSNGGVQVNLTQAASGSNTWAVPANTVLTDTQVASLRAGELYFNAHSASFSSGEIRGQINRKLRYATLNGGHEVPANASAATGTGFLSVDPTTRTVTGSVTLSGMSATLVHVHQGTFGQNGGVQINLSQSAAGSNTWIVPANTTLSAIQYQDFLNGTLYFNAHSTAFAGGEIRGQIDDDAHHHGSTTPASTSSAGTSTSTSTGSSYY
jgi:hypothetical protein